MFDPEDPEDSLQARKGDLRLLTFAALAGALGDQTDPGSGQRVLQLFTLVGQVTKESFREILPEPRLAKQLAD
ncbi:MAG TPA: hypothetical protein VFE21_06200 [Rubrobacteraceae bacterium]|nr:hypothetical protein [Rubrobacteraceae bacterium]